ncbi:ABC transporter permease [Enterocloster clostridioformis]|uniref:ABC transporter permease n=1 Tax=Enterocloster clostridioformis TaxID=1531 RepID=UPI00080CA222|nr:ABC transporter permease [Enterocloster clostridioformis]ANU46392.1 sugar ABC transporter permease [Lachnoclostridium sp. YL32]NDO31250.1 ABC transporter permease [Enterocloster clostridioformis]OXE65110.1 ABC transporter permease [Enterocloster clostridioformis]QQQ98885.1 ABC transporter permease [Enterocloster clostridioformis]
MEKKQDLTKLLRQFGLLFVILAIVIIMSIVSPVFLKPQNIINIIRQVSINGIIAVGMTCVILTGGIDLSVGSVVAITSVICGSFLAMGINWFVACISGVAISILFGLFNGYMISYVRFQPFIATLASMAIGRGIALAYSNGKPYPIKDPSFIAIGQGYFLGIPIPIILLVIVVAVGLITLKMTTFGRYIFAIGGNENAAKLSGVRTRRVKLAVYVISAICASIVGLILSARISSGQPTAGESYEMDAIAATAIGGTSMNGGLGSLVGTIEGFILLGLMTNSMNLLNINSFYQQIAKGLLIVVAVFLDMKSKGSKN